LTVTLERRIRQPPAPAPPGGPEGPPGSPAADGRQLLATSA
jgi:hypothetical protein